MNGKSKILLIDNEKKFCEEIKKAYENKFEITYILRPGDLPKALSESKFDLVLLDLFLGPEKVHDGFELINIIRSHNSRLPIIVITVDDKLETTHAALTEYRINAIIWKTKGSFEDWATKIEKVIKENPAKSVFISYSSNDKALAARIERSIRPICKDIWRDEKKMKGGDVPIDHIADGIQNATHFIIIFSQHSLESGWVRKELNIVSQQEINGKTKIIPILYGIERKQIPNYITGLTIDFTPFLKAITQIKIEDIILSNDRRKTIGTVYSNALKELDKKLIDLQNALLK